MTKPKVLIGLPTMGSIHTLLAIRIMAWLMEAQQKGNINVSIYPTMGVSPVDNARNEIVDELLRGDCTHLLFVDSDTIPPQNALEKMLLADKPIVTALTPIIEYDDKRKNSDSNGYYKKWNVVNWQDKFIEPYLGLIKIKGCGSSCILIKREVFEKMPKPWYRFLYQDDTGKVIFMGEDTHFIAKALGMGIEAWADTSIICGHNKAIIW